MTAAQRRKVILERLTEADAPLSASVLAGELGVSRQIVVGDVALLRAAGRCEEGWLLPRTTCTLTTGFSKPSKVARYLRAKAMGGSVTIPGEGSAEAHSSGSLSAMMGCNCLVELPAGSGPVAPGEEVEVLNFVQ